MQFKEVDENAIDSKNFIRLKDKESAIGVFRGELYEFRLHWINDKSRPCTGEGCLDCAAGNKSSFRFRLNLVGKDQNNQYVPKIFEQGWQIYQQLKSLHKGDYPLPQTILKITRHGEKKNTSYIILPVPDFKVNSVLENLLLGVKLIDLASPPTAQKQKDQSFDDVPF